MLMDDSFTLHRDTMIIYLDIIRAEMDIKSGQKVIFPSNPIATKAWNRLIRKEPELIELGKKLNTP